MHDTTLENLKRLAAKPRPRNASTAEFVAQILREAVLSGSLQPGQVLRQEMLSNALGVSRMPVREAIQILDSQGLVETSVHRGSTVAKISADDIEEIFGVRAALEILAIQRSVPHLTADMIERAKLSLLEMNRSRNLDTYLLLHRKFHLSLYAANCSGRLIELISKQFDLAERYLRLERLVMNFADEDKAEHVELFDACRQRDASAAERILKTHIGEAGQTLSAMVRAHAKTTLQVGDNLE